MRLPVTSTTAAAAALMLLSACGGDSDSGDAGETADDAGNPTDDGGASPDCAPASGTDLALEMVAEGFDGPIFVTAAPGDPRLFVVEQPGIIKVFEEGAEPSTFLDIRDRVRDLAPEQGLLGLAFHPSYPEDPRFFVDYTASNPSGGGSDPYKTVIAEYRVSESDPSQADPSSESVLLEIDQFAGNHNGGMLAFGPDGHLYVAMGDGGGSDDDSDPDKPEGHGQDPSTLLATLLRLDVSTPGERGVPDDNPYAGGGEGAPEVWAYGLRNPWRFSFDRDTGDLYIGDVGQRRLEEVDFWPAQSGGGANFGWRLKEGDDCFNPSSGCEEGVDLVDPVLDYAHGASGIGGQSITGGYVYRGSCLPDVQGWYFFGDYEESRVFKLEMDGGAATAAEDITEAIDPDGVISGLASFGEDAAGELYVVSRNDGRLYRIAPAR